MEVFINQDWRTELEAEFKKNYFEKILEYLDSERNKGVTIYPPQEAIFEAFNTTPYKDVSVVLLGQDPYHKKGQAMGLSFSVPKDVKTPPSLKNIYKELATDLGYDIPVHGDLTSWTQQGVLLLNAMLTVKEKSPKSHHKIGWQTFTDQVLKHISDHKKNVVFLLWGNFAKAKAHLIDSNKHLILTAAHPSPLARGAFFGNKHFSKTNAYLAAHGKKEINWKI